MRLTARYGQGLLLPALLYQLTAKQLLKQKKVSEEEASAAITFFKLCQEFHNYNSEGKQYLALNTASQWQGRERVAETC